jgi:hypothetical protein
MSTSVTVSGRGMRIRDRSQTDSILFSLTRSFTLRAPARSRICTASLSFPMDSGAHETTPEDPAQSEKRKTRRERKKPKHEAQLNEPTSPQPDNSYFLTRPWINLPEVNEAPIKHRARVMTWNVCPIIARHHGPNLNLNQLLAQCLVRALA